MYAERAVLAISAYTAQNPRVRTLIENYEQRDAELLDLRAELVRMKAFAHFVFEDMHPEAGDMHFDNRLKAADRLIRATDGIRKLVIKTDETLRAEAIPLKSFIGAQQEMATTLMAILQAELPPEDVQRIGHRVVAAWDKIHIDLAA